MTIVQSLGLQWDMPSEYLVETRPRRNDNCSKSGTTVGYAFSISRGNQTPTQRQLFKVWDYSGICLQYISWKPDPDTMTIVQSLGLQWDMPSAYLVETRPRRNDNCSKSGTTVGYAFSISRGNQTPTQRQLFKVWDYSGICLQYISWKPDPDTMTIVQSLGLQWDMPSVYLGN
ncbi:unnamed protein product [Parnassius apollo]|uniref:(apollo) hypothetical protein n=1 Tax=Parnassius apollo TaxID=110799 RepID=A0A8S3XRB5_PARAO|nr:unnamed protein product [Parnassius apollo]